VNDLDNRIRVHIYERFLDEGRPPSTEETAEALGIAAEEAEAAYGRLEQGRVIVLAPGTTNVWMANPLSAVPSRFRVTTDDGRSWWGNCVWDGLGVLAMVGSDGTVDSSCPDCGEKIELRVEAGELQPVDAVIHFAVPAARWWENIAFT
jgi:DNA-binding transcriptional MocR family regulator